MTMATVAEVAILTFMIGFSLGIVIKGLIDKKFERVVQKSLIRVGQMADDEIERKDKTIEDKNKEIERLSNMVNDLQIKRAIEKLEELKRNNIEESRRFDA